MARFVLPLKYLCLLCLVDCVVENVPLGGQFVDGGVSYLDGGILTVDGGAETIDGGLFYVDGGVENIDGGVSVIDGGIENIDGGILFIDGGTITQDGGVWVQDGGVQPIDGGVVTIDGGVVVQDGGVQFFDGGPFWTEYSLTGPGPGARTGLEFTAYDELNDRLILFSGDNGQPLPRPADVWVLVNATRNRATPSWVQLSPTGTAPGGRGAHTAVYDPSSNRMIVYGGCSANCGPALADTWVLTHANGLGGAPAWIQLPSAPVGRAFHSAIYDVGSNRMVIFGGGNGSILSDQRNDIWVLSDANGIGAPAWSQLVPSGTSPTTRFSHTAAYNRWSNQMIVFGGVDYLPNNTPNYFSDVWVLNNANGLGAAQWQQLSPSGTGPPGFESATAHYDGLNDRLLVFGGLINAASPQFFNDVWVVADVLGGAPRWILLNPSGNRPPGRYDHISVYSASHGHLSILYGQNFSSLFSDFWILSGL